MVRQLRMGEKSTNVLILESALSDVLCLVVGLALLEGISQGEVSFGTIFSKMWKAFVFAIVIGLGSGFIWSALIGKIRSVKNSMFTTLAFVFILYGVVELMGLNGGIAILSFGILLGNAEGFGKSEKMRKVFAFESSGFNSNERDFFSEIVFIMQTYFFVYVGISLQFGSLTVYAAGFLIVLLIILFRIPVAVFFTGKSIPGSEKTIMSVLTPKGLVPAVLASLPMQRGLPHGDIILDLGYSIVLFSIIICSVLVVIISMKPDLVKNMVKGKKSSGETVPAETVPGESVDAPASEEDSTEK